MERIERLEKLLQSRSYSELSESEKESIRELIDSEQEYEVLRKTNQQLEEIRKENLKLRPSAQVLSKIKSTWSASQRPESYRSWITSPIPTYAVVALVTLVGVLAWWAGSHQNQKSIIVENVKTDTVFIASKPDTIFREKIIYLKARMVSNPIPPKSKAIQIPVVESKGVSMKEKEELAKLLVSGSD
jgi:hypothetical protein